MNMWTSKQKEESWLNSIC